MSAVAIPSARKTSSILIRSHLMSSAAPTRHKPMADNAVKATDKTRRMMNVFLGAVPFLWRGPLNRMQRTDASDRARSARSGVQPFLGGRNLHSPVGRERAERVCPQTLQGRLSKNDAGIARSAYAESVMQRSPGLPTFVGNPGCSSKEHEQP